MERAARRGVGRHARGSRSEQPRARRSACSSEVRARGPLAAARARRDERPRKSGPWWDWSDVQARARVAVLERRGDRARAGATSSASTTCPSACSRRGARRADPDRATTPSASSCAIAARSLGVAAEPDLRDYFRLPADAIARRAWPSWSRPASCCRSRSRAGASRPTCTATPALPRRVDARALLGPFDPLIWERGRVPSGCSASATGSRSTCPQPKRVTATTCCRSCSATGWSRGSTSRPTARPGVLLVQAAHARAGRAAGDGRGAARGARAAGRLARAHASRAVTARPAQPSSATRISAPPPRRRAVDRRRRRPRLRGRVRRPGGRRPARDDLGPRLRGGGSASRAATMRTMARWRVEGMAAPSRGPVDSRSRSGTAR